MGNRFVGSGTEESSDDADTSEVSTTIDIEV